MREYEFPNQATPAGSSIYYCIRFSPKKYRDQLASIFLYKQTLRGLYSLTDPGVARIKLQWWHEQINEKKGCSEHPLGRQLADIYKNSESAHQAFDLINIKTDQVLHRQPLNTINEYQKLCSDLGGSFADLIQVVSDQPANDQSKLAGTWIEHVENMQLFGKLLRENIHLIPIDVLKSSGLSNDQLLGSDKTADVLKTLHNSIKEGLDQSFSDAISKKNCLGKLTKLRSKLMDLIEQEDMAVINQRISLTPIRKLWLAL